MRQSNRDQHNHKGAAPKRHVGSGYRGSYYGSDGYDSAPVCYRGRGPKGHVRSDARLRELSCVPESATIAQEALVVRCADISPDLPEQ